MENYTEEEYLKNRRKKRYSKEIFGFYDGTTCTIAELRNRLDDFEEKLKDKDDVDIWIDSSAYLEHNESYLMISWIDWESKDDFEMRMFKEKCSKERSVESLKRLIENNPAEAIKIIKGLGLI